MKAKQKSYPDAGGKTMDLSNHWMQRLKGYLTTEGKINGYPSIECKIKYHPNSEGNTKGYPYSEGTSKSISRRWR